MRDYRAVRSAAKGQGPRMDTAINAILNASTERGITHCVLREADARPVISQTRAIDVLPLVINWNTSGASFGGRNAHRYLEKRHGSL